MLKKVALVVIGLLVVGGVAMMVLAPKEGAGPRHIVAAPPPNYGPVGNPGPLVMVAQNRPATAFNGAPQDATGAVFFATGPADNGKQVWRGSWVSALNGSVLYQPGTAHYNEGYNGTTNQPLYLPPFKATGAGEWFVPGRGAGCNTGDPVQIAVETDWLFLNVPAWAAVDSATNGKYIGALKACVAPDALNTTAPLEPETAQLVGAWSEPSQPDTIWLEWDLTSNLSCASGSNNCGWNALWGYWNPVTVARKGDGAWRVTNIGGYQVPPAWTPGADWLTVTGG